MVLYAALTQRKKRQKTNVFCLKNRTRPIEKQMFFVSFFKKGQKTFLCKSPIWLLCQNESFSGKNFESNKNRERLKHKTESLLLFYKRFDTVSVYSIPFQFIRFRFSLFDSV